MKTILVSLFILITCLFGEIYSKGKIKFENISIIDGLSNPSIQYIFQDSDGFMWIGTADGLNKYDGSTFTIYRDETGNPRSIKGSLILDIFEDSRNDIWIGTELGLNKYNKDTDSFSLFQVDSSSTRQFYNGVVGITEDSENTLWIGKAYHGLTYFDRDSLKFNFLKVENADPANTLLATWDIIEDSNGELWYTKGQNFNSSSKLYKLNRERTREFKFDELVTLNERQKTVSSRIYKDADGKLWFSTYDGFAIEYDPADRDFNFYDFGEDILIFTLAKDIEDNIWAATFGKGLMKYDISSGDITEFLPDANDENSISSVNISNLFIDESGIFWLGTADRGLNKFDPFREPFELYTIPDGDEASGQTKIISAFYESKIDTNIVWVGTTKGLFVFDLLNSSTESAGEAYNIKIPDDLLVISLLEDSRGILWIGSNQGIYKFNIESRKTSRMNSDPRDRNTLTNNFIRSIIEDKNGKIWIGTSEGLNRYDHITKSMMRYNFLDTSYTSEVWGIIDELYDSGQKLASLIKIGNDKDTSTSFSINESKDVMIASVGEIFTLENGARWDYGWLEDQDGNVIWAHDSLRDKHAGGAPKNRIYASVLKLEPGNYVLRYKSDDSHSYPEWNASAPINPEFWGIEIYELNDNQKSFLSENIGKTTSGNSINDPSIRSVYEDNSGNIWIGYNNSGFSRYNPGQDNFTQYNYAQSSVTGFTTSRVNAFLETEKGKLWIATFGGLLHFDLNTGTYELYDTKSGIPSPYLMQLLADDNGNIWFSSLNGLTQFNPNQNKDAISFINYDLKDGLQAYRFSNNGAVKLKDGRLMFGGLKGFNVFYPGSINSIPPKVVLTKFFLSNQEVTAASENSPLRKTISNTEELNLAHNQNDISFEYTALHFARPDKNQYAHYLEGFDDGWIYDNRPFATYTNLDPGEYIFMVKASNSDGVWNEEGVSINLKINPPWWATIWAYISYALIGGGLFLTVQRVQRRKIIKEEREKQLIQSAELRAKAAEAESRAVKAESERKTKELEEARNLQLSMLPKSLPKLPNLDIAVYMKTATEVGGDYYDFHVGLDGTLTAVIGDATGHGLNAGTIVTITKSLFNSHGANTDILFTFEEISRILKEMKFKYLSMCLQILKIKGNLLQISSAGMPPALLYRKKDKKMEEMLIKGMPLGAPASFPYEVKNTELNSGDTILLMSDGFPELMNKKNEMFGYENAKQKFMAVAEKGPEEIIDFLKDEGSNYVDNNDPNDDVTFVVIKAN